MGQAWFVTIVKWGDQQVLSIKSNYKARQILKKQSLWSLRNQPKAYNNLRSIYAWKQKNVVENSGNLWHSNLEPSPIPPASVEADVVPERGRLRISNYSVAGERGSFDLEQQVTPMPSDGVSRIHNLRDGQVGRAKSSTRSWRHMCSAAS